MKKVMLFAIATIFGFSVMAQKQDQAKPAEKKKEPAKTEAAKPAATAAPAKDAVKPATKDEAKPAKHEGKKAEKPAETPKK